MTAESCRWLGGSTNLEHNFFRVLEVVWSNLDVGGEVRRHISSVRVTALGIVSKVSIVGVTGRVHEHRWNCWVRGSGVSSVINGVSTVRDSY